MADACCRSLLVGGGAQVSFSSVFKEATLEWSPPDTFASFAAGIHIGKYDEEG